MAANLNFLAATLVSSVMNPAAMQKAVKSVEKAVEEATGEIISLRFTAQNGDYAAGDEDIRRKVVREVRGSADGVEVVIFGILESFIVVNHQVVSSLPATPHPSHVPQKPPPGPPDPDDLGERAILITGLYHRHHRQSIKEIEEEFRMAIFERCGERVREVRLFSGWILHACSVGVRLKEGAAGEDWRFVMHELRYHFLGNGYDFEDVSARRIFEEGREKEFKITEGTMEEVNALAPTTGMVCWEGDVPKDIMQSGDNVLRLSRMPWGVGPDSILDGLRNVGLKPVAVLEFGILVDATGETDTSVSILFFDLTEVSLAKSYLGEHAVDVGGREGFVRVRSEHAYLTSSLLRIRTLGPEIPLPEILRAVSRSPRLVFSKVVGLEKVVYVQLDTLEGAKVARSVLHNRGIGGYRGIMQVDYYEPHVELLLGPARKRKREEEEEERNGFRKR
ncbi:hypothetical protein HK097_007182, partial [Rhizophlyctis rosea]